MEFSEPTPFAEARAKLAERGLMPSSLGSGAWRDVPVEIRERAFFSSRVESARLLGGMKQYLEDFLAGTRMENGGLKAQGRAEFVAYMREIAIREGLGKIDEVTGEIIPEINENDLTDIRSLARLQLIFDTQTEAAQEYGYWKQGQDPAILRAFPAQRFIRIRPVMIPRPHHEANEGVVKLKSDVEFWVSMNLDFNVPWGPWGFNSGMGVEDVGRREARRLDLEIIDVDAEVVNRQFNSGLSASTAGLPDEIAAALARETGGTVAGGRLVAREIPLPEPIPLPETQAPFERFDYLPYGTTPKIPAFTEANLKALYETVVTLPDGRRGVVSAYNVRTGILTVSVNNQDFVRVPWNLVKIKK